MATVTPERDGGIKWSRTTTHLSGWQHEQHAAGAQVPCGLGDVRRHPLNGALRSALGRGVVAGIEQAAGADLGAGRGRAARRGLTAGRRPAAGPEFALHRHVRARGDTQLPFPAQGVCPQQPPSQASQLAPGQDPKPPTAPTAEEEVGPGFADPLPGRAARNPSEHHLRLRHAWPGTPP